MGQGLYLPLLLLLLLLLLLVEVPLAVQGSMWVCEMEDVAVLGCLKD